MHLLLMVSIKKKNTCTQYVFFGKISISVSDYTEKEHNQRVFYLKKLNNFIWILVYFYFKFAKS